MDIEQAQRVQPGDTVTYQKARRRVVAVSQAGLWAPYFELDDQDVVSHLLVEAHKGQPVSSEV
jgi:hypothetical protein